MKKLFKALAILLAILMMHMQVGIMAASQIKGTYFRATFVEDYVENTSTGNETAYYETVGGVQTGFRVFLRNDGYYAAKKEVIGGKDTTDEALVARRGSGTVAGEGFLQKYNSSGISLPTNAEDYAIFEISMLANSKNNKTRAYVQDTNSAYHYLIWLDDDGKIKVKDRNSSYGTWEEGKWYRHVVVVNHSTGATDVYRNGVKLNDTSIQFFANPAKILKIQAEWTFSESTSYAGVDDLRYCRGIYDPAEDLITLTSTDENTIAVDSGKKVITGKGTVTVAALKEKLEASGDIRVYKDSAYTTLAAEDENIERGMTVVVSSSNGKSLEYFEYASADDIAMIDSTTYALEGDVITVPVGTKVSALVEKTILLDGNTAKVLSEDGAELSGADSVIEGCKFVAVSKSGKGTKEYKIKEKVLFESNFENWSTTSPYASKTTYPTPWIVCYMYGYDNGETADSLYLGAVTDEERGGKVMKLYSKALSETSSNITLQKYNLDAKNDFLINSSIVFKTWFKLQNADGLHITSKTDDNKWIPFASFNNGKLDGTNYAYDNGWHELNTVLNRNTGERIVYIDGQKLIHERNESYKNIGTIKEVRVEQNTQEKGLEKITYLDDLKIFELDDTNYTNTDMAFSTMISSNEFEITTGVEPSIKYAIGKTVSYALDNITLPTGATAAFYNGEELVSPETAVASGMVLRITSRTGMSTDYEVDATGIVLSEMEFSGITEGETVDAIAYIKEDADTPRLLLAYYNGNTLAGISLSESEVVSDISGYKKIKTSLEIKGIDKVSHIKAMLWSDLQPVANVIELRKN